MTSSTVKHYDHIVVGAGINGSFTTYQLARRGVSVLLLEQFPLPHSRGSSHGASRGIRRAYPDPYFTGLMEEAYREWHHLEMVAGVNLIQETGLLCFSEEEDNPWLESVINSFKRTDNKDYSVLAGEQFREKYPYIRFDSPVSGCLDPTAGVVMADRALRVVQDRAKKLGAHIKEGCRVGTVESFQNFVRVTESRESGMVYTCQSVVLCPGPWAGSLLSNLGISLPLRPQKIPVYYWKTREFLPHTFIYEGKAGSHIWGLPPMEYPDLAKICLHSGPDIDPDYRDQTDTECIKHELERFIGKHFPGVEPQVSVEESCIYTVLPDWNPCIDTIPGKENIVIAVGFSGTGFKLGPVTGRMCADLAQSGKRQEEPRLRVDRFQEAEKSKL